MIVYSIVKYAPTDSFGQYSRAIAILRSRITRRDLRFISTSLREILVTDHLHLMGDPRSPGNRVVPAKVGGRHFVLSCNRLLVPGSRLILPEDLGL